MRWTGVFLGLFLVAFSPRVSAADDPLAKLDEFIVKAMKDHEVPGLAIAVVKDGETVFAKGYGVRELGKPDPVDPDTMFAIGSCSKAFTAAALALLVDEGKLKWDDKVIDHLPDFRMYDPYVTREMTVRDLLAHRCGLTRHDLVWYRSPHDRAEVMKRFRLIPPDFSFRAKYSYHNGMYLVAGQLAGAVAKTDWDTLVADRLFKPLGMAASNTTVRDLSRRPNVASPHARVAEKWAPVPWLNIDNVGPAGSINSNVNDIAKWVAFQLGDGTVGKARLLTSGSLKQMQSAHTVVPVEGVAAKLNPDAHLMSYGLGWIVNDYRGKKVVHHSGGIDGMTAETGLLPEEKLGVVVLNNRDGSSLPTAVMNHVFDRYLSAPPRDWNKLTLDLDKFLKDTGKQQEKSDEQKREAGTKPTLALDQYEGEYKDELHGPVKVAAKDGKLTATFHGWAFDLEHWHHDVFRAADQAKRLPKFLVQFTLDTSGKVAGLKAKVFSQGDERLDMKRTPPKSKVASIKLTEAELKQFVGRYESKVPPLDLDVELVGGKLKMGLGGGESGALEPVKPTRFKLMSVAESREGFVQFELDAGAVKGVTLEIDKLTIKFQPKK
jgi:CubicO group peptidase (beta-lactamase class C family)